jgi:hypothetical protein
MGKSMGKLGAKLTVREQSRRGEADSIDADGPKPEKYSFDCVLLSFRATGAFEASGNLFGRKEAPLPDRPSLQFAHGLPYSTFQCYGEFHQAEMVTVMSSQKAGEM